MTLGIVEGQRLAFVRWNNSTQSENESRILWMRIEARQSPFFSSVNKTTFVRTGQTPGADTNLYASEAGSFDIDDCDSGNRHDCSILARSLDRVSTEKENEREKER